MRFCLFSSNCRKRGRRDVRIHGQVEFHRDCQKLPICHVAPTWHFALIQGFEHFWISPEFNKTTLRAGFINGVYVGAFQPIDFHQPVDASGGFVGLDILFPLDKDGDKF